MGPDHKAASCGGGSRSNAGSLAGGIGVQEILGLVPVHQWVKPCAGASAGPLMGRAASWGLAASLRCPKADVGLLMGGLGS